jgi:hypothetical protein
MTHSGAAPFQIAISSSDFTVTQSGTPVISPLSGNTNYTSDSIEWAGISVSATETISFDSRGRPSCTVACSTPADTSITLTLSKGGENRAITIEKFTGYAHSN